jgi:16S rRNA (guanine966-N2)-methyltransferase
VTRIIGGRAGGRRLRTPSGEATRPTSDRVREALFSSIESWAGSLQGLRFLDLYAGSGAVGLEAWSRGASAVTLVESDRRTAALIRSNAGELGADVDVVAGTVSGFLRRASSPDDLAYDVVFSDPPYPLADAAVADDLQGLVPWLGTGALVVVERSARSPEPAWPDAVEPVRTKRYGETALWYGHAP